MEAIKKGFRRIRRRLSKVKDKIPLPERTIILISIIILFNFIAAVVLRLGPIRYGIYLNEYDPFFQYYMADWIVKRGWWGFVEWFSWHYDPNFWYPNGRDVAKTAYPGVAFMGAFIYLLLRSLGLNAPLLYIAAFIPVIFNSLIVVAIYFLGKEIHSRGAGLIASTFLAISPSMLSRSVFGFFDDDNLAILFIIVAIYSFIKGFKYKKWTWGVVAGLSTSYVAMTWGAYIYLINLFAIFIIATVILGIYERWMGITYLITSALFIVTAIIVPRTFNFFRISYALPTLTAIILVIVTEILTIKGIKLDKIKLFSYGLIIIVAFIGLGYILQGLGVIRPISGRFLVTLIPFLKSGDPLIESVGEHQTATWYSFFIDFGALIFFAPIGFYMLMRRGRAEDLFITLFGITAIHGMASLIRLTVLAAPAISLIGGIGASIIYVNLLKKIGEKKPRGRRIARLEIGGTQVAIALLILTLIILLSLVALPYAYSIASQPQSVLSAEAGSYTTDWISAFEWMKNNLPPDSVVASWWDYGYWITVNTGLKSIADNANFNKTQVVLIAKAFMSDEETALKIFKKLDVDYVLVFENFLDVGRGTFIPRAGDFEKSYWMARIGFNYNDSVVNELYMKREPVLRLPSGGTVSRIMPTGRIASNTTLYRLLFNRIPGVRERFVINLNIPPPEHFQLVFASKPNAYVLIYKVNYPEG